MHDSTAFGDLVGGDLTGVTFVREYVQLQFNPAATLSAFTPVTVMSQGQAATLGESAFPNLILAQRGKFVAGVVMADGESLTVTFEDHSQIVVSLQESDYVGPEALTFASGDNALVVI
ncbi:MAG TPA: hypothetical protein VEV39_02600 [Gemmatimonadales bacterium]|nr:hypothetical protein [Gemmatimonadales bacterium]